MTLCVGNLSKMKKILKQDSRIRTLYFLNKKEEKQAIKIYKKLTGKDNVITKLDSLVLTQILRELSNEKLKKYEAHV